MAKEEAKKQVVKNRVKVIRAIKSPKSGGYTFKSEIIPIEKVKDYLKN